MSEKEIIESPKRDTKITYLGQIWSFVSEMSGSVCAGMRGSSAVTPINKAQIPEPKVMK